MYVSGKEYSSNISLYKSSKISVCLRTEGFRYPLNRNGSPSNGSNSEKSFTLLGDNECKCPKKLKTFHEPTEFNVSKYKILLFSIS